MLLPDGVLRLTQRTPALVVLLGDLNRHVALRQRHDRVGAFTGDTSADAVKYRTALEAAESRIAELEQTLAAKTKPWERTISSGHESIASLGWPLAVIAIALVMILWWLNPARRLHKELKKRQVLKWLRDSTHLIELG